MLVISDRFKIGILAYFGALITIVVGKNIDLRNGNLEVFRSSVASSNGFDRLCYSIHLLGFGIQLWCALEFFMTFRIKLGYNLNFLNEFH